MLLKGLGSPRPLHGGDDLYHLGAIRRRTHGIVKEFGSIPSILCLFSDSNGILKQPKVKC